jgi:hypothetical protein
MFLATHASILTSARSTSPRGLASQRAERSPTDQLALIPRLRYRALAPLYCRRKITRPVSYYALFQGWLLLSQPPGCLSNLTTFAT